MRLIIAEKPSLGKAIAARLPGTPQSTRSHITVGDTVVTWAFGHLLEQAEPDDYLPDDLPRTPKGSKKWRIQDLPILPEKWLLRSKPDSADQLEHIGALLKKADSVVNAGDPDREGQLLIDEILEHFSWKGPTQRIWLAALDDQSVDKALATLKDNREYQDLKNAALARSRADWLVGMNLTRSYSLKNQAGVLSVGRVQTPTLALIVNRDQTIEHFKPTDFYVPRIFSDFWSAFRPAATDGPGFDSEGRLVDKKQAESLVSAAKASGKATVTDYTSAEKKQAQPLGFSLAELQKTCSAKFGMSAKEVLDTAQALYEEHKCTSYPRSDCRYLPAEQHGDSGKVLHGLSGISDYADLVAKADKGIKSPIWDTSKITAHHAIIPTGESPSGLSPKEKQVFDLIVQSYLAQFFPPFVYRATKITLECASESWSASGKVPVSPGWKAVFGMAEDDDGEDAQSLPTLAKGDVLPVKDADVQAKRTTPPARFSDGTIIDAMSNIHRFIDDVQAKARLKETSGIGTEATRANVLETLLARGYIERKGKTLVSTGKGRDLIRLLPPDLTDAALTAGWEDRLADIAAGNVPMADFMKDLVDFVKEHVAKTRTGLVAEGRTPSGPVITCPVCGGTHTVRRLESKKKPGIFFWACSNKDAAGNSAHALLADDNGKPGKPFGSEPRTPSGPSVPCPVCGNPHTVRRLESKKKPGVFFWACSNKDASGNSAHALLADEDGKPGKPFGSDAKDTKKKGGKRK